MFVLYNEYDKMSTEYNYKHINIICPECKHDNILVDDFHQETYCTHCGLILQDTTIFRITIILEHEDKKNRQLNNLWHKVRNPNIYKWGKE